jgi:hypothetical protein
MADSELVTIPRAELERLQKLEAELPLIIEKAKEEGGMGRLKLLHEKQKENPEKHREKAMKRYNLKKEEINAKRREAYRLKKSGEIRLPAQTNSPGPI